MAGNVERELRDWFRGAEKVVVAGIGNPIRSDDYVGLKIVEGLQGKVRGEVCLLECETVPESYLLEIEKLRPTHVLLIDAANLGIKPGEARLVDANEVTPFSAVSSHVLPLRIFCEYLKKQTNAKVALLLVEPESLEFGEGLSPKIKMAAKNYVALLLALLG
jgi:hydrogenase 3 maturation protease